MGPACMVAVGPAQAKAEVAANMRVSVRLGVAVALLALATAGAWLAWTARRSHTRPPARATFVSGLCHTGPAPCGGVAHGGVRLPAG